MPLTERFLYTQLNSYNRQKGIFRKNLIGDSTAICNLRSLITDLPAGIENVAFIFQVISCFYGGFMNRNEVTEGQLSYQILINIIGEIFKLTDARKQEEISKNIQRSLLLLRKAELLTSYNFSAFHAKIEQIQDTDIQAQFIERVTSIFNILFANHYLNQTHFDFILRCEAKNIHLTQYALTSLPAQGYSVEDILSYLRNPQNIKALWKTPISTAFQSSREQRTFTQVISHALQDFIIVHKVTYEAPPAETKKASSLPHELFRARTLTAASSEEDLSLLS